MNRWVVTIEGHQYKPLIYAETAERAIEYFDSEVVTGVQPYSDTMYLDIIQELKDKTEFLAETALATSRLREWYEHQMEDGILRFRLCKDGTGFYYDLVEYQFKSNDSLVYPVMFTISNLKDFYDLFFTPPLMCEIVSYRLYGQPKLTKPDELKGVKESFSADHIPNKCKCQCFIKGDDLWIKHRDFFSAHHRPDSADIGTPLSYRARKYFGMNKAHLDKFVYPDSWGEIVLRNEAWIVFRNLRQAVHRDRHPPVKSMLRAFFNSDFCTEHSISSLEYSNSDWKRFFEKVCFSYRDTLDKEAI